MQKIGGTAQIIAKSHAPCIRDGALQKAEAEKFRASLPLSTKKCSSLGALTRQREHGRPSAIAERTRNRREPHSEEPDLAPFSGACANLRRATTSIIDHAAHTASVAPAAMTAHAREVLTNLRTALDGKSVRMTLNLGKGRDVVVSVRERDGEIVIACNTTGSDREGLERLVQALAARGCNATIDSE